MSTTVAKKSSKKTATPVVAPVVAVAPVSTKKTKTAVVPPVDAVVAPVKKEKVSSSEKKVRVRRAVSRETLDADFDEIQKRLDDEISRLRQSSEKVKGVKFLRTLNKSIKSLKADTLRVMKIKPKNNRTRPTSSGFMKPVNISAEMSAFTGWDVNTRYSRVDVTRFICDYIKTNKLQNDLDKRQILCDPKLQKLLKYDPDNLPTDKKTGKPATLTYFRLQQYIQPHFVKNEE